MVDINPHFHILLLKRLEYQRTKPKDNRLRIFHSLRILAAKVESLAWGDIVILGHEKKLYISLDNFKLLQSLAEEQFSYKYKLLSSLMKKVHHSLVNILDNHF